MPVKLGSRFNELDTNVILDIKFGKSKTPNFEACYIDDYLSWKNVSVSKTTSRNLGVMNKLKHHFVSTRVLHYLYCTHIVLPYLNYGILVCRPYVYGDTCKSYL